MNFDSINSFDTTGCFYISCVTWSDALPTIFHANKIWTNRLRFSRYWVAGEFHLPHVAPVELVWGMSVLLEEYLGAPALPLLKIRRRHRLVYPVIILKPIKSHFSHLKTEGFNYLVKYLLRKIIQKPRLLVTTQLYSFIELKWIWGYL